MKYFRTHRRGKPRQVFTEWDWEQYQKKTWQKIIKMCTVPTNLLKTNGYKEN